MATQCGKEWKTHDNYRSILYPASTCIISIFLMDERKGMSTQDDLKTPLVEMLAIKGVLYGQPPGSWLHLFLNTFFL